MLYLASPYSHPDPTVRKLRASAALRAAASLLRSGVPAFSPIVYGRQFELHSAVDPDFAAWQSFNFAMLSRAQRLMVLKLPGWNKSEGVAAEIAFWNARREVEFLPPVEWMDPE